MWAEIKKDVELAVPFSAGGRKELKQFALFFFFNALDNKLGEIQQYRFYTNPLLK